MENGSAMATAFTMQLVQLYLIDERQTTHVTEPDLFHSIEILARMSVHRAPPEGYVVYLRVCTLNVSIQNVFLISKDNFILQHISLQIEYTN